MTASALREWQRRGQGGGLAERDATSFWLGLHHSPHLRPRPSARTRAQTRCASASECATASGCGTYGHRCPWPWLCIDQYIGPHLVSYTRGLPSAGISEDCAGSPFPSVHQQKRVLNGKLLRTRLCETMCRLSGNEWDAIDGTMTRTRKVREKS